MFQYGHEDDDEVSINCYLFV